MKKKIIPICLLLALMVSMFTIGVSAADNSQINYVGKTYLFDTDRITAGTGEFDLYGFVQTGGLNIYLTKVYIGYIVNNSGSLVESPEGFVFEGYRLGIDGAQKYNHISGRAPVTIFGTTEASLNFIRYTFDESNNDIYSSIVQTTYYDKTFEVVPYRSYFETNFFSINGKVVYNNVSYEFNRIRFTSSGISIVDLQGVSYSFSGGCSLTFYRNLFVQPDPEFLLYLNYISVSSSDTVPQPPAEDPLPSISQFIFNLFGGIFNALDTLEFYPGFSILDVLKVFLGLSAVIAFLKLFAGG